MQTTFSRRIQPHIMLKPLEFLTVIVVQILLLTVGSKKLAKLLVRNYIPPNIMSTCNSSYIAHYLFSLTFTSSCALLLLVFGEITQLFSNSVRSLYWRINLDLLLILIMIVIPWFQTYIFLVSSRGWRSKYAIYVAVVTTAVYLYLLNQLRVHVENPSWIEMGVIRMSMIGVTVISILSGFGMAHTPFMAWYQRHVTENDYRAAERAYSQTSKMLQNKKLLLDQMKRRENSTDKEQPSGYMSRWFSSLKGQDQEIVLLDTEVDQLKGLVSAMKSDLEELERGRTRSIYSNTWKGKTWNWVNKGLAVYCVYRFFMTMIYIILGKQQGTSDPVTRALSIIISRFDSFDIDPGVWSQQLSFWFAGIIVFTSVRSFLKLVSKILDIFMLQITFSTPSILVLMAQIMGMYFLSSALVIQMNLPPEYRYLLSSSIQAVEFNLFKYWSDAISVISCIVSYCIIYALHQTQNAIIMARDFTEIELLTVESGLA